MHLEARSVVFKLVTTLLRPQYIKIIHVIRIMMHEIWQEPFREKLLPIETTLLLCISQQYLGYFWIKMRHKLDDHSQSLQIPLHCMSVMAHIELGQLWVENGILIILLDKKFVLSAVKNYLVSLMVNFYISFGAIKSVTLERIIELLFIMNWLHVVTSLLLRLPERTQVSWDLKGHINIT